MFLIIPNLVNDLAPMAYVVFGTSNLVLVDVKLIEGNVYIQLLSLSPFCHFSLSLPNCSSALHIVRV